MTVITYNNHYKMGYNGVNDFQSRATPDDLYTVSVGRCTEAVMSFHEESIKTAKIIQRQAGNQQIWISGSGGIDSEYVMLCFLEAKVPFKVLNAKFKNDYNDYDQGYLKSFCQKHDLYLNTVTIDLENFFNTELNDYAIHTTSVSPQFPVNMKLWDSVDGYIVTGNGDPVFRREPCTNNFYFQVKEKEDSVFRYFLWRDRDGCPGFYNYRPEMILSFMMDPEIMKLFLFGGRSKVTNVIGPKELVYNRNFMIAKREDATGFEDIKNIDSKYRTKLENLLPGATSVFKMEVPDLINDIWPESMSVEGAKYLP